MIVLLTHNYPNPDNPLAGLFVRDHEEHLRETTGEEVRVFNYPFGEYPMTKSVKNPLKWPKFIKYFFTISRDIRRDIETCIRDNGGKPVRIIAHWWIPQGVYAAKHFDSIEVICHGTDMFWLQKYPMIAHRYDERAKTVRRWQCVSSHLKSVLLELYPFVEESRVEVEPMPLGRMFENRHQPRQKNLVISVGSLIKRKGFDRLISEIAATPNLRLEIYGQGPEKDSLHKLIESLGVGDRIRLMGPAPREELVKVYNRAVLFALLSYDEGFGLVLKEAQACGCKTLAFLGDGMVDTKIDFPVHRDEPVAERIAAVVKDLSAGL
jgi:glycosyltransferase involved in cell wall biosynthesis